jgi:DNA-binding CsgD family transcriptional regulator/tetratricopeptide (TPR) repeat protein
MQLLERGPFLRTLAEYADEARRGDGRLVLVSGESGMGKTALLEACRDELRDARWLWGACDGLLTPRPLGPLFDVAAQLDGELADLCRDGAHRDRLFAAFLAEIDRPATFTVTVVEDVHWADEATIDLLSFVGRRLARMRALVLVTYREDELGADHPLRIVLGDLATQRATRRMRIPPLSVEAVRELAGSQHVDAGELHRVTGGNPFYVREVLEAGWPSIPPTVRDVVGARLARSSADARRAVEAAAVIGARVDRRLLVSVGGGSQFSIDDCLATGILVPDGAGLRFRHELVRMAVAAAIPPHRKTELHASLLAELELDASYDADLALLAHHAEAAGDAKAVLRHAPEAARRSSDLGAHRESAAQYERALRFASDLEPADRAPLHEGLAGEYALLDRWEETEATLQVALAMRRDLGDTLRVGADLWLLSTTLWRLCRGAECEQAALEAVRVLETQPAGRELAWAYANLGAILMSTGPRRDGLRLIDAARELGEQLGQPDVQSYALNAGGLVLKKAGQDGMPLIEHALRIALDADIQEAAGRAYSSLQEAGVNLHRFDDAERYYLAGMAYCDGRELGVYSLCLTGWRAQALHLLGRFDEAAGLASGMLKQRAISPVNRLNPLRVLGSVRGRRGEPGAWELLDEALASALGTAEPAWVVPVRALRTELCWVLGEPERAAQELLPGYDLIFGQVDPYTAWSLAIWLRRLGLPNELPPDAPEPYAHELAGDWQGAAAAWERLSRPYDAALVRQIAGDEAALRSALATLEELGATATAAAARRRMRDLGLPAIPRGPRPGTRSAPAGLTAREQEVLALLSEGLADKEISRRLFISERTVHHHVSAVLAKIGATSRSAAAAQAARLGITSPL